MPFPKAKEIRSMRIRAGHSLHSLSDASGIHYSTIAKIEKGNGQVTPKTAKAISDSLGVSFDELFTIDREGDDLDDYLHM